MITVFKRFNLMGKIGMIGALIGFLIGMAAVIAVSPWFGIILTVVSVAFVYFCIRIFFGSMIRQEELMKNGVQAEATILEVKETGMTVNEIYPVVKLVLEVRPPEGEPFQVETKELISRFDIPTYQPGAVLPVLYDPRNHKKVAVGTKEELAAGQGAGGSPAAGMFPPGQAAFSVADMQDPEKMRMVGEFLQKENQKQEEIRASGKPAKARILSATPMGINVNGNNPAMTFMIEVHPEGEPPFQAQTNGVISEASVPKYQPGCEVFVKYDPNDRTRVSLDHS